MAPNHEPHGERPAGDSRIEDQQQHADAPPRTEAGADTERQDLNDPAMGQPERPDEGGMPGEYLDVPPPEG